MLPYQILIKPPPSPSNPYPSTSKENMPAQKLNRLLCKASEKGDLQQCKILIKQGADARGNSKHTDTPIMIASRSGHSEIVRLLISHGANTNDRSRGDNDSPLIFAGRGGSTDVARLLIAHSADVSCRDAFGFTALMWAASKGHLEIVDLLLENGADPFDRSKVRYRAVYIDVCMYMCIFIYVYICIYVIMYVCMYAYIYICIYICIYVCIYIVIYHVNHHA